MKYGFLSFFILCFLLCSSENISNAQESKTESDTSKLVLDLQQALNIALSDNISVKIADKEVQRSQYAKRGSYAALFPQINATSSYQRTLKRQVMYFDLDPTKLGMPFKVNLPKKKDNGIEVGRLNTFDAGITANLPLINAELWESLKISGKSVEMSIEKARASRLDMVNEVQKAFYSVLLAKEVFNTFDAVYKNALYNLEQTKNKYDVGKVSELELLRAKSTMASAIPEVVNADNNLNIALWQLKALLGIDLSINLDCKGKLSDYSNLVISDVLPENQDDLKNNTTIRQLEMQFEQLAMTLKMKKLSYIPNLSLAFSYRVNATANDFEFRDYRWTPSSFIGVTLSIPIFSGGKRYYDIKQTKSQLSELSLQIDNTKRNLLVAMRQYVNTMKANVQSYKSAVEAQNLAQRAYDLSQESYKIGKTSLTDLNAAQLTLTQSRLATSKAEYNFLTAKSELEKLLGVDYVQMITRN